MLVNLKGTSSDTGEQVQGSMLRVLNMDCDMAMVLRTGPIMQVHERTGGGMHFWPQVFKNS
jgi:hypothetical protein